MTRVHTAAAIDKVVRNGLPSLFRLVDDHHSARTLEATKDGDRTPTKAPWSRST